MKYILLLLLILSCCACGSVDKTMIINKEYENIYIKGSKLGIVIPESVVSIDSAGIVDMLGEGDSISVYLNFFRSKFPLEVKRFSNIAAIEFSDIKNKKQMQAHRLEIYPVGEMDFYLPAKDEDIILDDGNSEFVLIFDDYSISSLIDKNGSVGRSLELTHQFKFAIWDNTYGTIVSFGRMKIVTFCAYPNLMAWDSAIREIASSIFMGKCPFSDPI